MLLLIFSEDCHTSSTMIIKLGFYAMYTSQNDTYLVPLVLNIAVWNMAHANTEGKATGTAG